MEFHDYVRSLGLDPLALAPDTLTVLEAAWRDKSKVKDAAKKVGARTGEQPAAKEETLDDIVASTQAELDRKSGITKLAREYLAKAPDRLKDIEAVARLAIDGGWSVKETEFTCSSSATSTALPRSCRATRRQTPR